MKRRSLANTMLSVEDKNRKLDSEHVELDFQYWLTPSQLQLAQALVDYTVCNPIVLVQKAKPSGYETNTKPIWLDETGWIAPYGAWLTTEPEEPIFKWYVGKRKGKLRITRQAHFPLAKLLAVLHTETATAETLKEGRKLEKELATRNELCKTTKKLFGIEL